VEAEDQMLLVAAEVVLVVSKQHQEQQLQQFHLIKFQLDLAEDQD
jgi:hypothetical protein